MKLIPGSLEHSSLGWFMFDGLDLDIGDSSLVWFMFDGLDLDIGSNKPGESNQLEVVTRRCCSTISSLPNFPLTPHVYSYVRVRINAKT